MTPLDDLRISPAQRKVLHWLRLYPQVSIWLSGPEGDMDRPRIYPWWRDDEARKHMIGTMEILGKEVDCPVSHPTGGTPSLRRHTFEVLLNEGLITITKYYPRRPHVSEQRLYGISDRGRSILLMAAGTRIRK